MANEVTNTPEITVSKPQFNTDLLKPGTAVRIVRRAYNGYKEEDVNALVTHVTPLQLQVVYMKDHDRTGEKRKTDSTISIDSLGDGNGKTKIELIRGL